ncbi:redoxin domain-containing protein [Sphingobacterium sp. Mn56C]|uniref:redoxin domain-containing protein n=1 Tax=Sphingobacterium sp. Mn56C TaxID=3395261 RepID=UPI003BCBECEC
MHRLSILCTVFLLGVLPAFVAAQAGKFTIQGKTDKVVNGKIYLHWFNLDSGKRVDSSAVVKGRFAFRGSVGQVETGQLLYKVGDRQYSAVFYLEPGTIKITLLSGKDFPQLGGTPLNRDYHIFYGMLDEMLHRVNAGRSGQRPYDQFNKEIQPEKLLLLQRYSKRYSASRVFLDQVNMYSIKSADADGTEGLWRSLAPQLQQTEMGMQILSRVKGMRSAKIGDPAPDFTLPDKDGNSVSLHDFKGKYVLLDFWATWCGPCLAEMPNVKAMYDRYKDKGFVVVGVSLDRQDTKAKWLTMIADYQYNWVQLSDLKFWNSEAALRYNVNSVPTNYLIDPSGKVIAKNVKEQALRDKMDEIFNKK